MNISASNSNKLMEKHSLPGNRSTAAAATNIEIMRETQRLNVIAKQRSWNEHDAS
jgi:hypothetical protein